MSANPVPVGKMITEPNPGRDAIHIAIAPCVAQCVLEPGTAVSAEGYPPPGGRLVGIVDPFLGERVLPGQRFYIFLYPNTVTSLRHEWEHPAFPKTTSDEINRVIAEYLANKEALLTHHMMKQGLANKGDS